MRSECPGCGDEVPHEGERCPDCDLMDTCIDCGGKPDDTVVRAVDGRNREVGICNDCYEEAEGRRCQWCDESLPEGRSYFCSRGCARAAESDRA